MCIIVEIYHQCRVCNFPTPLDKPKVTPCAHVQRTWSPALSNTQGRCRDDTVRQRTFLINSQVCVDCLVKGYGNTPADNTPPPHDFGQRALDPIHEMPEFEEEFDSSSEEEVGPDLLIRSMYGEGTDQVPHEEIVFPELSLLGNDLLASIADAGEAQYTEEPMTPDNCACSQCTFSETEPYIEEPLTPTPERVRRFLQLFDDFDFQEPEPNADPSLSAIPGQTVLDETEKIQIDGHPALREVPRGKIQIFDDIDEPWPVNTALTAVPDHGFCLFDDETACDDDEPFPMPSPARLRPLRSLLDEGVTSFSMLSTSPRLHMDDSYSRNCVRQGSRFLTDAPYCDSPVPMNKAEMELHFGSSGNPVAEMSFFGSPFDSDSDVDEEDGGALVSGFPLDEGYQTDPEIF